MRRHAALLSLLLAAGAVAGPTDPRAGHRCASYCLSADNSKFAYTAGQTYVYAYTSDVVTTLAGATDEASRLHVKATAEIAANSACDFTLQLRDVTLEDSDPKNVDRRRHVDDMAPFKDELEKYPLSFSYQDGRVEELCSSQFESVWALNFKRGLLSATVNNLETLDLGETQKYETDVSGYCSTNYTVRNLGDITAVIKTKELLTCRERGHLVSSLQTTPYHSASNIQSMPLLRSTQRCRQAVSAGRLLTVVCQEDHLFRPFSGGGNGAVTRTTLTLTEMNVRPTVHTRQHEPLRVRSSAMFDHSAPELKAVDRADATRLLLAEMQRQTAEDVRREVPRLFTQLVQTLRQADAASLARLLREQTQQTTRKYLMDALPMLGTAAALVVMRDMVMLGQVASEETDRWMTSLAFVHEPRLDMVEAVAPLLADAGVRTQTLLGVSAMLHRFCRADVDCAQRPAVRQAVSSIEQLLGGDCASESREGRTRVLAALKALGNVGLLIRGEGVLRACFASKDDVETRLEAIRAYRRMPCAVVSNSGLVHTFANHLENSEVRIAAYLAVTQCATHEVVDKLMEILSKETVNQVGSFVWTHITNMQETNDPSKQYLKSLLYNVELSKKFATDARKFSRYYEKSAFFESVNAGGSVEGAVVFSPESYIPRSGMLNLTVDLFGEAINLLEVGGRVEGLEHYVENLFGNKGPYPQESISQILRTMRGRPSSNDITRLSDAYNAANDASGSFHASSYVKIFGNELSFGTFDDLSALVRALGDDGPVSFLQKLAKDRDWTDNYQFLDTSYTIPTMTGLPFKLRAVGAATVTLKTSGRFNIESWNKMNIEGFIKPSAAVEIAAEMSVDAHVARTGLKMNTNLHTSTALDGQVVIDSAKIVSIKMNMPKDKVEMLDVRTSFHSVYQNQEIPLETTSNKVEYGACSEAYTAAALGVNICSEICYPLPAASGASFLLTGPLTARITVEKTDTVKAFIFEYRHSNEAGVRKSSLMLDTPGTTTNRHINLDYMINFRNKAFRVGIITPVKSVELAGSLDVATERKHAALQLDIDRREIFGVAGSLTKNDTLRAVEYQPLVVIRGSSGPLFRLKGEVLVNKDKPKYAVRLRANTLYNYPIVLTGSVDEDDGMYSIATSLSSHALTGTLNGMFRHDGTSLVLQTATEYSVLDGPTRTISLNTKMDKEALGEQALYKLAVETKLSALPLLDTELRAELARSPGQHRATAELMLGQRRYQLSAGLGDQRGRRFGEIAFQAAHMDVDFKLATELDMSTKQRLQLSTMARLNQDRFAGGSLTVSYLSEGFNFDYGVDTNITLMTSSYALVAQVRRDDGTADLTFLASREVGSESRTVRLTAALGLDETDAHTLDASLDLPNYPSTRLSGRLAAGSGGRYLVSGQLQRGPHVYMISGQYRYEAEHVLELRARLPRREYTGTLSARTEGGNYKVKADLQLGRRIMTVVSVRPGGPEMNANFELFWNKDVDDSQHVIMEISRRGYDLSAKLRYPGRQVQLLAGLTSSGVRASLEYAPDKVILLEGRVAVQSNNKLALHLNIQTPLPGYRTLTLTFQNKPDVTGVPSLLNFKVAGNIEEKEVILNGRLVADFAMAQDDIQTANIMETELDLTTPFVGWERSRLELKYVQNATTFHARMDGSKNKDGLSLGANFEKTYLPKVFAVRTGLFFELPVDRVQSGALNLDFTIKDSYLDAKALAQWNGPELKTLELTVQSRHNLTSNVLVDSHVMLKTPFEKMHKLNSHFELRKNDTSLSSRFTATDGTGEELLITELKGLVFGNLGSFAGNFLFACDVCPTLGIAMECAKNIGNSQFNITTLWRNQEATLTGSSASTEGGVHEYALALHLPNPARRYHLKRAYHFDLDEKTIQDFWEVARDDQAVTVNLTANWNVDSNGSEMPTYSLNAFGQVRSPFEGWESSRISESCAITVTTSGVEYTNEIELHKGGRNILITERGHFRDLRSWQLDREVASNTGWFSHSTQHLRSDWTGSKGTVTCRVTWDEQTAELTYVDAAPAGHSSGYNVTLTAQWFGQRARRVSFLMVSSAKAWTPLITVSYAPGKTIKISGEIYRFSAASESHLTLEAPFTDVILLKTSHDIRSIRKRALLEVFHGQRAYSLQIDVDTDFRSAASFDVKLTSPTWFLGSNTLSLGYQLGSSFVMRGEVSHADWRLSLHSDMGRERGEVEVTTPFGGLKKMSFRYTISSKAVLLRAALGNSAILLTLNDESDYDMIEYSARLSTPYEGFRILTVVFSQPRGQKLFSLRCAYDRRNTISINGEYELSGPRSSVTVQIRTSFDALPAASLQLSYDLLESTASLQFARGRDTVKIEASADISLAMSSLTINYWNSLIAGPRRVTLTGAYDVQSSEKLLDMVLEKDSDVYFTRGRARLSTESSYVTLNAGTPLPGYEKLSIVSYLSLTSAGPALTFELTKNNATVQATFEVNVTGWSGTAVLDIETLFDDNRHITLAGKYEVLPSSASVELVATRDSIRKTIRGTVRLGDHGGDMSIITPFHGFETFDVEYSVARADNKREVELILRRGQDEIQLLASGELSRSQPRIAIEVRTPMETAKTLSFNARYDIDSTAKVVHVTLARNNRRLELKISGEMHIDSAEAVLTLNTPFPSWENVKCSAMYDLRSAERKAEISYDRNGNKTVFSARSFYDAESAYLHVVTPFEGFESLGVSIRYANTRHKREVGYEAHVNEHRHRLYLLYERSGTDSIKLRMNTPIHDMHVVEVDLRRQSFSDGVGMYADLNLDGKHTSVELRTTLAKKTMGIDIYLKSHRKGFENVRISGSVNLAKKKKAFRLASQSKTQKIELSGFFAIKGKGGIGKLVSKLPLPGLEKVNVKVRYTLGKKNKFKLIYVKGKKKTQISGDLTYTDTSFTINLKTPFNGFQKIKANAGRTTDSDGTVSAELSLQRSNRAISVKYSYLFSLKKGDGSIEIATPYEGFEDMKMSLTYNNLAKSRNMKFTARRNSREWHIESSRSWGDGIEDGSLVLRSPLESIRSVKINRSFNIKNLEAMRYLASYERNDRKFVITGTGSIRQSGKEVSLDVTVETPLEIGQLSAKAGYDFTRMPMSLRSNLSAGPRHVNVEASLGATSGTVNVQATSGGRATGLDIDYTARLGDRTREVSANLVMKDGRRLSVLYTADQSRPKTGSGTIKVDSTTFGDRELKWSFSYPDDDLTSSISYKAPNVQAEWSLSVQGTMLVHRKIIASSSINSPWHTSTTQVDVMFDRRNGLDLTADVSSNGRQYKLLIDKKSRGQMQVLSLSYDGHFAKNVKIDGTWSSLRGVDGRRSFEFTYSRGRQKASLSGSVQLGSAGKSGATSLHLTTPFAEAAVVKLEVTWNFISPNAILKAEYSRNGVSYLFVQSGSHHQQSGEYAVQISMPNVKVYNRKSFSGIEMIVSYDLSKGVHVKVHMDRPFESTVEVKFTKTRAATTLKLLLHFMDKLDLIPQINHRHFQLDYTSERRRVGPLIEATLATNVFDLGKVELSADIQKQDGKTIIDVDYKRGSKAAHILGEISRASGSGSSSFSLKTPISGYEDVSLSGGYQFSPGHEYALNIEYSRGQKFIHFDSSSTVSVKRAKGKLKSVSASADIQISSKITTPMQLSVTASSDIRDIGTPKQSGEGKVEGTLNGKKLGLTYSVERDDHGRRVGSVTITTPFKNPYKKIVLSTDVSLHSNKASTSIAYGPKKVSLQLSWFKGEANQYGAEVLLESPYAELKSLELEAKGTLNSDGSVDVLGHYRRNNRMVHVTGTVRRDAFDLRIKTPNSESFRVQGGVTVDPAHKTYSIRGLVTMPSGASAGGELTVKAAALNNMQLTVDVHTPLPGWERFNADVAYTDVQGSRVIRVAFESPQTKRMEVGIELTSQGGRGKTDLRAGITTNYLGSVFTFRTHIFRDTSGMKYELEIESPFHIDLPGLPSDH